MAQVNINKFGVPVGTEEGSTLMPKLQYRFRVTFSGLGGETNSNIVTRNVVSVTRPSLEHDDVTIDAYNSKIRMAGKHTWQDVSLVIRDDVTSKVVTSLGKQLNEQLDHANQSAPTAGSDYKFGMSIEMLDGSNDGGPGSVIDAWHMTGCFIPSIQYGDLNYATSEVVQVTVSIRYDNAEHTVGRGGEKLLSGAVLGDSVTATRES